MSFTIEEIKKSFEENPKRKYSISGHIVTKGGSKISFCTSEAWIVSIKKDRVNFEAYNGRGADYWINSFCVPFKDWNGHSINRVRRKKVRKR